VPSNRSSIIPGLGVGLIAATAAVIRYIAATASQGSTSSQTVSTVTAAPRAWKSLPFRV
jgi:DNA-binding transcriptional MocR family regulator